MRAYQVTSLLQEPTMLEMVRSELDATRASLIRFTEGLRATGSNDAATRKLLQSIVEADRVKAAQLFALIDSLEAR
jgi:hypothetical protein